MVERGTNPLAVDSDGDGATDFEEVLVGRDPLDPTDGDQEGDVTGGGCECSTSNIPPTAFILLLAGLALAVLRRRRSA